MRAKDLMAGDWVQNPLGWKAQVQSIRYVNTIKDEWEWLVKIGINNETFQDNLSLNEIDPIPLTLEILEKNGFEKLDFSHFQIGDRRLVLDADGRWDGPLSWHWVVTEMDTNAKGQPVVLDYYVATINYVHELQHCLKLVGIDKEIQI